jgi:AraC family L-rhamnose operon regulatory protein RhaS
VDYELLDFLRQITDEEEEILAGRETVKKEIYTSAKDFTIDSKKMLAKGKLIDIRTHTRFIHFPKHRHNYIEIIYVCSGKTTHIINGKIKVQLKAGELLFLNQFAYHEIEKAEENDIAVNFFVLPEFFDQTFEMIGRDNILSNFIISSLRQDSGEISYLHFKVADELPVQNLAENLVWSIANKQSNSRKINQTTMGLLFLQLLNCTEKIEQENLIHYDNALVIAVLRQIEENYKFAKLSDIATQVNQPLALLSRLIKKQTGLTFKELLQQKRFTKAAQLLNTTHLSISDIILAVGYDNTSYFYRTFKKLYGMSPHEFREMNH